jgi:hypothetical protein
MSSAKKNQGPVKPKTVATLADMCFYFDAVERDRLDGGGQARKASELLALREALVRLPDAEFDTVMKTVRSVLSDQTTDEDATEAGKARKKRSAVQLYQDTRGDGLSSGAGAASKIPKV